MTSASSLAFPGSKTLAGWWRQLASFQPQVFAVGYLFVHRVEAPAIVSKQKKLDRLSLLVLEALELDSAPRLEERELLGALQQRLHLEPQILLQMLRALLAEGLAGADQAGHWALTERGRLARRFGELPGECLERRSFPFLECCDPTGARIQDPRFLNLAAGHSSPWVPGDNYPFDPGLLHQCLARPESWKKQTGFSLEIREIPSFNSGADQAAWQKVIIDRPERLLVVLALVPGREDGPRLLAFSARQDGWALRAAEPILDLQSWEELFPELENLPEDLLARAWHSWASPRGVPESEITACTLVRTGHQLHVRAPAATLERLRTARSDIFKGEAWLLVGEGRIRVALQMVCREPGRG